MSTMVINNEISVDCFAIAKVFVVSNKMRIELPTGEMINCESRLNQL
jgi:hypothetical protein